MKEEDNSKKEELAQDKNACDAAPGNIKRVWNSLCKRKNAVLNNFNVHVFKYVSDHE